MLPAGPQRQRLGKQFRHFVVEVKRHSCRASVKCLCAEMKHTSQQAWKCYFDSHFQVEDDLDRIKNASSQQELMSSFKDFGRSLMDLNDTAGKRQTVSVVESA